MGDRNGNKFDEVAVVNAVQTTASENRTASRKVFNIPEDFPDILKPMTVEAEVEQRRELANLILKYEKAFSLQGKSGTLGTSNIKSKRAQHPSNRLHTDYHSGEAKQWKGASMTSYERKSSYSANQEEKQSGHPRWS